MILLSKIFGGRGREFEITQTFPECQPELEGIYLTERVLDPETGKPVRFDTQDQAIEYLETHPVGGVSKIISVHK
jgi:HEPN domain-containing protein